MADPPPLLLCRIKEKFPYAFDDVCLYSEVSHLLAHCVFRLASRRFIQELFQDVQFTPVLTSSLLLYHIKLKSTYRCHCEGFTTSRHCSRVALRVAFTLLSGKIHI